MNKISKIAALVGSLLLAAMFFNTASADANPFAEQATHIQTIAGDDKDKCGEGKCGDDKEEGKCGDEEGKCGDKEDDNEEGKCGEGKCGGK